MGAQGRPCVESRSNNFGEQAALHSESWKVAAMTFDAYLPPSKKPSQLRARTPMCCKLFAHHSHHEQKEALQLCSNLTRILTRLPLLRRQKVAQSLQWLS